MSSVSKLFCCILLAGMLAGCGFKDGSYSALVSAPDSLGYEAFLNVTVADGIITGAEFDAANAQGQRKSSNEEYARLMVPATGVTPGEISQYYQQLLLGAKSYGQVEVDAISGATVSSDEFARLWAALEDPLKTGENTRVILSPAPEFRPSISNE